MTVKNYPTQTRLRELFTYGEETGVFTRAITTQGPHGRVGQVAGCLKGHGYIHMKVDGVEYGAHRLAWIYSYGRIPDEIDHINGIRDDNRLVNLRDVSSAEQSRNRARRHDNSSGTSGVCWRSSSQKWRAYIGVDGKPVHLGYFAIKADAIAARKEAEHRLGFHPNNGRLPRVS